MSPPSDPPRRRRSRHLTTDEDAVWSAVAATVEPLKRVKSRIAAKAAEKLEPARSPAPPARSGPAADRPHPGPAHPPRLHHPKRPVAPPERLEPAPPLADFDRKKARRIAAGREEIDARIDLHGMRQTEAHAALRTFLLKAHAAGRRTVLVITGKGGPARDADAEAHHFAAAHERGVLKRNVPRWLAEPELRAIVVSYRDAAIQHGGEGALYIQLRAARRSGR